MKTSLLKKICLTIACVLLASTNGTKTQRLHSQQRIIGGRMATEKYPFIVSILLGYVYDYNFQCAGTIVNKHTVLTAAHCLFDQTAANLKIHAGEESLQVIEGKVFDVKAIHVHTQHNITTQDYDAGLIRIKGSFTFNNFISPIQLASRSYEVKDGSYATVLGWGYTNPYNQIPAQCLMMARVPIVSQAKCAKLLNVPITNRMLCAGYDSGGVDACQLDSGGPLIIEDVQVGIVSWGMQCALPNKPGVYARVSALLPWIEKCLFENYLESLPNNRPQ